MIDYRYSRSFKRQGTDNKNNILTSIQIKIKTQGLLKTKSSINPHSKKTKWTMMFIFTQKCSGTLSVSEVPT